MPHAKCVFKNWLKAILSISLFLGVTGHLYADALDTWTTNQVSTNFGLTDITYGNGRYVAVGQYPGNDSGAILSSDDGLTWTPRNFNNLSDPTFDLYGVAYGAGTFVAVGFYGSIYASTNGIDCGPGTQPHPHL